MKKYIALGIVTILLIGGALLLPQFISSYWPTVKITSVTEKEYISSVTVSGTAERAGQVDVTSEYPLVIKSILCKEGDYVEEGDTLLIVDRQATVDQILQMTQQEFSGIAGEVLSQVMDALEKYSADELIKLIPNVITAPSAGAILSVGCTTSSLLLPGEVLVSMANSTEMTVRITIPEDSISSVTVGQTVEIIPNANKELSYSGTIVSVSEAAYRTYVGTSQQTVVDAIATLDKEPDGLKPGYTVKATIKTSEPKYISLLPYDSVLQDTAGNEYVYVYREGEAIKKIVETGMEIEDGIEIVSGIYPSDDIVYDASKITGEGGTISVSGRVG